MNIVKAIFLPLILLGIIFQSLFDNTAADEEKRAEQIIKAYMDAKGLKIKESTKEYELFLRGIFWGEYPDLTSDSSEFIDYSSELEYVFGYAWKYSGYKDFYGENNMPEIEEATFLPNQSVLQEFEVDNISSSEGRLRAILYAYQWSTSGFTNRNPAYPDFGLDDCTNFVSQTMVAGGFWKKGSGDGCKHENTYMEWYVEPNPYPSILCLGDFRYWEWSTSWSVPDPFRYYFAYENSYAISHGWTTSVSTAKYYLSPGDVVQLQFDDNGTWVGYHTMIVTDEDEIDLYVTYHSNAGGLDEVDKPLSSINLPSGRRFVLVEMKYPWLIYMPITLSSEVTQGDLSETSISYPAPMYSEELEPLEPYPVP